MPRGKGNPAVKSMTLHEKCNYFLQYATKRVKPKNHDVSTDCWGFEGLVDDLGISGLFSVGQGAERRPGISFGKKTS